MLNTEDTKQVEELLPQDGVSEQEVEVTEGIQGEDVGKEAIAESDGALQESVLEDGTVDIVIENSKLENYETILTKFTDILTLSENSLLNTDVKKTIVTLGGEVYNLGSKYFETNEEEDLYKFLAKNFEYIGMYLFTFSDSDTLVGVLTTKIDTLLYDFIGNQEDLLAQFNLFQQNFRGNENDIKSVITPLIFNLSNLGTNIGCIKTILHYLKLQHETSIETILENIIVQIEK